MRKSKQVEYTIQEAISAHLKDGREVTGTLWLHASRVGSFEVEYDGRRASDNRTDYTYTTHLKAIARRILAEMAGE